MDRCEFVVVFCLMRVTIFTMMQIMLQLLLIMMTMTMLMLMLMMMMTAQPLLTWDPQHLWEKIRKSRVEARQRSALTSMTTAEE